MKSRERSNTKRIGSQIPRGDQTPIGIRKHRGVHSVRNLQQFLSHVHIHGLSPRKIIAMIKNGFKDEALRSFTIWLCPSCYTCQVRCPSQIKITDVMYALNERPSETKVFPSRFAIPVFRQGNVALDRQVRPEFRIVAHSPALSQIPPFSHHAQDGPLGAQTDEDGTGCRSAGNPSRIKNSSRLF